MAAGSDSSAGKRLIDCLALISDHENAGRYLREMLLLSDRSLAPETSKAIWVCSWVWHTSALGAKATNWGRRQLTYSNFAGTFSAIPIDPSQFPITSDEEAREFWEQRAYTIPFDGHEYLHPGDFPASVRVLADFWKAHPPAMDPDEAEKNATRLLEEASALRKWTIPPRAMVDLKLGPFAAVEVTEIGDEIYFVWRTENERYWRCSVGVRKQGFDNVAPYAADRRVEATMKVVMAALVRDFWIAEDRRRIFDVSRPRRSSGEGHNRPRVVYLPRIRYVDDGLGLRRISEGLEQGARTRHFVQGFFRKVTNPSLLQLEIARNQRIVVPDGHTYVRPHYRGGGENQLIYRSRSAMQLLFQAVERPEINPKEDDWFEFERMTATLLEVHLGFTVLSRAPRGGGDGGIDVLATKPEGDRTEIWVVQCKCYSASNPVGPAVIRELVGTMAGVRREEGQAVRGMIVTSSRFTPELLRLAVSHGVQTIDRNTLIDICAAVNLAPRGPLRN